MHLRFWTFVAAALAWAVVASTPARAASVLPLYLDEMIDTAAVAFEGRCVGNRTERDEASGLIVTYTTFEVRDALKGPLGATHTIKQVGGALPGEGVQYRVQGIPTFTVGEDYVVLLAGVSSAGFSSPVGLAQGRFGVRADAAGRKVFNGRDFKDMAARVMPSLSAAAQARLQRSAEPVRELDLDEFKQLVRARAGRGR